MLGPGLLETAYEAALAHELSLAGVEFRRQVHIAVSYKGQTLDVGFRADFIVEQRLIVELKAVDALLPIHTAQLITYLRLSGLRTGLLINFNAKTLTQGLRRISV